MERLSTTSSTVALASSVTGTESGGKQRNKEPRRLLHFSDGVIEEYSTDEEEEEELYNQPTAINPSALPWLQWMWYYMHSAAVRTFSAADGCGERLAWLFGITSPKYQYAIDEYNRQQAGEREEKERELREREAVRNRRSERYNEADSVISTVSVHQQAVTLPRSDRTLVMGYQAPSSQLYSESRASIAQPVNQSLASVHSSQIMGLSAVKMEISNSSGHAGVSDDLSIFPA